jgi:ribosomal protein S18 acetylase RimI-like enzyme
MEIRFAEARDEDAVFELAKAMATSFHVDREAFSQIFASLIAKRSACLLVAEEGTRVSGYLLGYEHDCFYANGPVGFVEEICVEEGGRRQGAGRRLMDAFESIQREHGAKIVGLMTRRAGRFYDALGYEQSATYYRKLLT